MRIGPGSCNRDRQGRKRYAIFKGRAIEVCSYDCIVVGEVYLDFAVAVAFYFGCNPLVEKVQPMLVRKLHQLTHYGQALTDEGLSCIQGPRKKALAIAFDVTSEEVSMIETADDDHWLGIR